MHSPLARFVRKQIDLRRETVKEYALRAGLNPSGVSQLLRGERDWVQSETLSKIAAAAGMTEAQMFQEMYGGEVDVDPEIARGISLLKMVPDEKKADLIRVIETYARSPVANATHGAHAIQPVRRNSTKRPKGENPDTDRDYHALSPYGSAVSMMDR